MLHVRIDETSREINPEIETDKYGQEEGKTTRRNYIKKGRERERETVTVTETVTMTEIETETAAC